MSSPFHSSLRPGSGTGRGPAPSNRSSSSTSGAPRFQSLTRIANQVPGSSTLAMGGSGEEELRDTDMLREGPWKRRWSGDKLRYEDNLGCTVHEQHLPFFVPSYLKESSFVERVKRDWEGHLKELEEGSVNGREEQRGSSSTRKGPGSHRGVAQDVIERPPAGLLSGHSPGVEEESGSKGIPSRWNEDDKWTGLEVLGDGSEVKFSGICKTSDEAASIRTDHHMPMECGLYYYEVTILSRCKDALIGIGFSGKKTPLNRLPGWETESWGYHGDDGYSFACSANGKGYGPKFASQDVIGCGLNFRTGQAFFTKNGVHLGTAFTGLKTAELYPSIGIKKSGEHLRANFGRTRFVFDIDGMMAEERRLVRRQINDANVSVLHPPDDENTLIQKLVAQYLAHEGYVETSKAFAADVRDRATSLNDTRAADIPSLGGEDDVHTMNRQKIRRAILDGDIDKALKYTQTFYPNVLQDKRNESIYFQLRCRKFVEMMRRYSELQGAGSLEKGGSNGHAAPPDDNQMELDDQLNREQSLKQTQQEQSQLEESDDIDMDTSTASLPKPNSNPTTAQPDLTKSTSHLTAAIQYGQELQAEFGSDPRPAVKEKLREVFAIMAYVDPQQSIVGGLLDRKGRAEIAEGVNGAVLVSLGKPSEAALEKLCAQTEVFLEQAAAKVSGKAGFVNLRRDFLRGDELR